MAALQQHSALLSQTMSPKRRGSLAFPVNNLRRYVTLVTQQIAIGASLIVKHPFIPPPVPTWPLHLALFVAVVRATADYQEHIVEDISDIRRMIDTFFYYLPKLPMMHIVPYKLPIPARGRGFPGVLEPLEQSETGHRTLPGIWIADSKVWSNVMKMPIAQSAKASKDPYAAREGEKVIFYTHGGGYFICSTATHREMLWRISRATGRRIFGKFIFVTLWGLDYVSQAYWFCLSIGHVFFVPIEHRKSAHKRENKKHATDPPLYHFALFPC